MGRLFQSKGAQKEKAQGAQKEKAHELVLKLL